MPTHPKQFDIALGHCTVQDDVLVINRPNSDELTRLEVLRNGLTTSFDHQPWFTGLRLGGLLILGLIFAYLLVYLYASNPAVAPLVGVLGFIGLVAGVAPLEWSYRRAMSQRQQLRQTLSDEFQLSQPRRIPVDEITEITVRSVSTKLLLSDGFLMLVHFHHDGNDATTYLGFPEFMTEELSTAQTIFEQHEIPVRHEGNRKGVQA